LPTNVERTQSHITRLPPHNDEAEKSLLGAILLEGDTLAAVLPLVNAEDFYATAHQKIFECCSVLFNDGKRVDAVMIREELRRAGDLDSVGGEAFLAELVNAVPSAAGAEDYARIVSEKAVKRNLIHACTQIQSSAYEESMPGPELLDWAESEVFGLSRGAADSATTGIKSLVLEAFDEINEFLDGGGAPRGVATGFLDLDERTAGLGPGDLVIVAGRPSMGKTTFANCIVDHVGVVEKKPVAYFSVEVSAKDLVRNMLCSRARVELQRVRRGLCDKEELRRLEVAGSDFMESHIFVDDSSMATPIAIRAKARRLKQRHGLGLVVVDYLQLMETGRAENRQQEIAQISRQLKGMARELEVPVIALSQLLRESGSLEQDADLILFLYRDSQYNEQADPTQAEVIIAKQRSGPTGKVGLRFFGEILRFENEASGFDESF
jgi:replicative DNA helicase